VGEGKGCKNATITGCQIGMQSKRSIIHVIQKIPIKTSVGIYTSLSDYMRLYHTDFWC